MTLRLFKYFLRPLSRQEDAIHSASNTHSATIQNFRLRFPKTQIMAKVELEDDAKSLRTSPRKHVEQGKFEDNSVKLQDTELLPFKKLVRARKVDADESDDHLELKRSPKKRKRGYTSPEVYAHLHYLQDYLKPELDVMFCGINPGCKSATDGHHFAHGTNHFWRCLHQSGFTPKLLPAAEDLTLPERFCLGLTNMVERPSAEQSELLESEMASGVQPFLEKVIRYRPRIVCFIGMGMAKVALKHLYRLASSPICSKEEAALEPQPSKVPPALKLLKNLMPGMQPLKLVYPEKTGTDSWVVQETLFYCLPSTSARVIQFQLPDKVKLFSALRAFAEDVKQSKVSTAKMSFVPSSIILATK